MQQGRQIYQQTILESLAQADKYNAWLISKFKRYLGKNILELGSGLGSITFKIEREGYNILPSDIDQNFLKALRKINKKAFYLNIFNIKNSQIKNTKFDTILAINVLEHIAEDPQAFKNIYRLLSPGGNLIIIVPAHQFLFGSYDTLVGHQRRYSKDELLKKLYKTSFLVEKINYYNKLSALGWFINARLLKRKSFPKYQLYFVNSLVPFIDFFDYIIPFDFGLSIICVARKNKL